MKVISIKEPFATLIKDKFKKIETRSFKTNYRGEIYIHVSGKTFAKEFLNNKYVIELSKNITPSYGYIICKGNLIDCIYMDEEFLAKIKKDKQEYNLGLYEKGRYAWILSDIKPIKPIKAKGKLNIWNYEGENK